jgi:O-antigen ligase
MYFGGLLVTQARSALVLAAGYAVWKLTARRWSTVKHGLVAAGMAALFVGGGFVIISRPGVEADSRWRILNRSVMAWQARPWLGWGFANVDHAIESTVWPMPYLHDIYVDKAHSIFLEVLVTTGVVGLVTYAGLAAAVVWRLRRNRWLLSVALLYLLHSQTNVISINEEFVFWWLVGIAGSGQVRPVVKRPP